MHARLIPLFILALGACASEPGEDPLDCTDLFFADSDGDGFGDPGVSAEACEAPIGFIASSDDCDDADDTIHPGAAEVCDGADNDCNALVDSADPAVVASSERAYYRDRDSDGYGDPAETTTSCDRPAGYVVDDTDCNDAVAATNPGALEVCDELDNDCDAFIDDFDDSLSPASTTAYYLDGDLDGFGAGTATQACEAPSQHVAQADDCDDAARDTYPGAAELCDGRDNDCDDGVDGTQQAPNQCGGFVGGYAGSYSISAVEKVGSIIVNQMHCTGGTSAISIDLAASPVVQGTVTCTYSGGLVAFDNQQDGTLQGTLALDGTFKGSLVHDYRSDLRRTYLVTGSIVAGELVIDGMSTLLPHPMSAVPWEVDYYLAAD